MARRLSTGLRNALLGAFALQRTSVTITGTDIAAVDGGAGNDTITQVAAGFVDAGFKVGDSVVVIGFTGGAAGKVGPFTLLSVEAGTLAVATGSLADDDATESVTITAVTHGSFRSIFTDCILDIYSGTQPATADLAESGTKLVSITLASGAFVAGSPDNGLNFGAPSAGVISKNSDVWSGAGLATGTAGWARLYANAYTTGASSSAVRLDMSVGTSGADLDLASLSIVLGRTVTIDTCAITLPAA